MIRYAILALSFPSALFFLFKAYEFKFFRPETAFISLGIAGILTVLFLYALIVKPQPKDGSEPRPSIFRLLKLWMLAKEKDLAQRVRD
jgi:hypothetical protein